MSARSKFSNSAEATRKKTASDPGYERLHRVVSGVFTPPGLHLKFGRAASLYTAVFSFLVFTVFALIQRPELVPHPSAKIGSLAFWRYPLVINDIKRLPAVTVGGTTTGVDLHAVWVLQDGMNVWLAGNAGTLLHSPDGGTTWDKLPPEMPSRQAQPQASSDAEPFWRLVSQAMAAPVTEPQAQPGSSNAQSKPSAPSLGTGQPERRDAEQAPQQSPALNTQSAKLGPADTNSESQQPSSQQTTSNQAQNPKQSAKDGTQQPDGSAASGQGSIERQVVRQPSDNLNRVYQKNGITLPTGGTSTGVKEQPATPRLPEEQENSPGKTQLSDSCSLAGMDLHQVYFSQVSSGWVAFQPDLVSYQSSVCGTNDAGRTWHRSSPASIIAISNQLGWSLSNRVLLRNSDRSPGNVLEVGKNGAISAEIPGTWELVRKVEPVTAADLNAMVFAEPYSHGQIAYIVGDHGTALKTLDGGITWFAILQGLEGEQLGDRKPHKLPAPWYYISLLLVASIALQAAQKPKGDHLQAEESIANIAVSDRPLQPTDPDPLGYKDLALSLSRFLRNENTMPPISIAITGEWGTGKSSIMNLLRCDLAARRLRPIWFNAWHNQTEDDLFATILQAIRKQGVPQWWEMWQPDHIWFRLRLLGIRWANRWQSAMILASATAFLLAAERNHLNRDTLINALGALKSWDAFISALQGQAQKGGKFWILLVCLSAAAKYLYDGLKAFGVNPANLLASRSGATSLSDLEKQTALRQRFGQELQEVTRALGARRRMVLFIDDLDRCMPDNIRIVLEAVNFIVTSGECFVIMGLARRPVEAGIGLSFDKIVNEITTQVAKSKDELEENKRIKRWDFSRQYLDKLINIEVPARAAKTARFEALVIDNALPRLQDLAGMTRRLLNAVLPAIISILLVTSMVLAGLWIGAETNHQRAADGGGPTQIAPGLASRISTPDVRDATLHPVSDREPAAAISAVSSLVLAPNASTSYYGYLASLLFATALLYACWRLLTKKDEVVVRDSPRFRRALEIWDTVIVRSHATPRSTKRFMNRVRCLAMRLKPPAEGQTRWALLRRGSADALNSQAPSEAVNLTESTLVALSAIYDLAPEIVRNDDLFVKAMKGILDPMTTGEVPINSQLASAFSEAVRDHENPKESFRCSWPPTNAERQLFLDFCADVIVRG